MIKVKDLVKKYGEYEIDEQEIEKVLVKPKPKSVWQLKDGDFCCIMTEDGLIRVINFDEDIYFSVRELGMLANNEQELIDFRECLKIRAELLKLGGRERLIHKSQNWCISYNYEDRQISYENYWYIHTAPIFFDTVEQAENAVKEIGEDRLKKYWFKVEEE